MRSEPDGHAAGARRASGRPAPPAVVVYHHSHPGAHEGVREIHAGLEEEGVLVRTEERPDRHDERAIELAYVAACASNLAVGVGLDAHGSVCLHHAKLDPSSPLLLRDHASRADLRQIGQDAARLVKGVPLTPVPADSRTGIAQCRNHE